jgi:hypothetical protein
MVATKRRLYTERLGIFLLTEAEAGAMMAA